jgi:hypothetical protein
MSDRKEREMKTLRVFAGGIGAGAALMSMLAAAVLWRADGLRAWMRRDRAEKRARLSPNFLDVCRAAGL